MNEEILEFELNLDPNKNWMLKNWGLICNPFADAGFTSTSYPSIQQRELMKGLALGTTKGSLSKFLPQLGLSKEATDKIISKVEPHQRYKIKVTWNPNTKKGTLEVANITS